MCFWVFNRDIVLLQTSDIGGKTIFGANTFIYASMESKLRMYSPYATKGTLKKFSEISEFFFFKSTAILLSFV